MATHRFVIEGRVYQVEVGPRVGGTTQVTVNGRAYAVEVADAATASAEGATSVPLVPDALVPVSPVAIRSPRALAVRAITYRVRAPIAGVVRQVMVAAGEAVADGTVLLVLEAMKMENEICATSAGIVEEICVSAHQEVREGDVLVVIEGNVIESDGRA